MIKEIIELAKNLGDRYDNNIYSLIKDYNYKIIFRDLKNTTAYTIKLENINYIVVSNDIDKNNLDFVLAHEFYHAVKHDNLIRHFSKLPLSTDKYELHANLFATIFLGCTYQDCTSDNYVQKIINYIHCNYFSCDRLKLL